jgi:hypothetical protein
MSPLTKKHRRKPIRQEKITVMTSDAMMAMAVAKGRCLIRKANLLIHACDDTPRLVFLNNRAVTPRGRPMRSDTKFFCAHTSGFYRTNARRVGFSEKSKRLFLLNFNTFVMNRPDIGQTVQRDRTDDARSREA